MSPWGLDVILVVLLVAHWVHGYRRGFLLTLTETVGFVAGAVLAWVLLRSHVEQFTPERLVWLRPVIVVAVVLIVATLGQYLALRATRPLLAGRRTSPARNVDRFLGGVLIATVGAAVIWFVAGVLQTVAPPSLTSAITQSRVLRAVDSVMPSPSERVLSTVIVTLNDYGFPPAFTGLVEEPISPVDPGDPSLTTSAPIVAARASVVQVDARALHCGGGNKVFEGTGWVVDDQLVVTNAHVVAGAERVTVQSGQGGRPAQVIGFDPRRDLAVLSVSDLAAPPLPLGTTELPRGASAVVAGYPLNQGYVVDEARVKGIVRASGPDIYNGQEVEREIYALRTTIQPGNSGGPLIAADGRVAGVVFARSTKKDDDTAYALTLTELREVLDDAQARRPVGTGDKCAAVG